MIKKVLLINGSPNEHGCTDVALLEAAASLNKNGIETEILWLGKQPMQDCIACYQCRQRIPDAGTRPHPPGCPEGLQEIQASCFLSEAPHAFRLV